MSEFSGLLFWGGIIIACCGAPGIGIAITIFGIILLSDNSKKTQQELEQKRLEEVKKQRERNELSFLNINSPRTTRSTITTTSAAPKQDNFEVYVEVRFDNYYRTYTYLAPTNRFLKNGERIRIMTHEGIKSVTVVKGNYKCPKKTDMNYKRIDIR